MFGRVPLAPIQIDGEMLAVAAIATIGIAALLFFPVSSRPAGGEYRQVTRRDAEASDAETASDPEPSSDVDHETRQS